MKKFALPGLIAGMKSDGVVSMKTAELGGAYTGGISGAASQIDNAEADRIASDHLSAENGAERAA